MNGVDEYGLYALIHDGGDIAAVVEGYESGNDRWPQVVVL